MTDPSHAATANGAGATRSLPPADAPSAGPSREGDAPTADRTVDPSDAPADTGPPNTPPGYELLEEVGRGGMGVVYRARELALNRHVAVKVLQARFSAGGGAAARFVEEAQITGQLQHPGIPPVHQVGTLADGRPFLVMKLIKGRTLEELLKERADPAADRGRFLAVFEQVCQAVACAHEYRVIHRDLKPANVMVGKFSEVQVMDWGLAKPLAGPDRMTEAAEETPAATVIRTVRDSDGSFTQAGSVLGTPAFMPPEQAGGEADRVDERSDVFGLGAILCVVLTGRPPFVARDAEAVRLMAIRGQLGECLVRLDGCGAEPDLVALCKRCLAADPADRPRHAGEVAKAVAGLRAAAEDRAKRAELDRAAAEGRASEQRKRRKVQAALGLAFTALVVLAGAFAWWQDRQAADRKAERARVDAEHAADRAAADARAQQAVESAVTLAADLRDRYRFDEAALALDQASALVPADAPAETRNRLSAARADLAFVRRLDEIRISRIRSNFSTGVAGLPTAYAAAFREHGLDPTDPDPAAVAARVAASPIKRHLLIALDDWAWMGSDVTARAKLLAVTRGADPGAWSDRLRNPSIQANPAALSRLAAEADPETIPANLLVLLVQMRGAWPGAEKLLTAAAIRHPDDFWVQFEAGYYYHIKLPRPSVAVGFLRTARSLRPDLPMVVALLGLAQARAGLRDEALATFREALRLDPKNPGTHLELGNAHRDTGDLDGAVAAFRESIRLDPKSAGAHINLGVTLKDKGDLDGAIAEYREALRCDPNATLARHNLGDALRAKGDLPGAITAYREAVRLDPLNAHAHLHLGIVLFNGKGDVDGSIAELRKAIRLDPKLVVAYSNLGLGLRTKGDLPGAIEAYRKAVQLEPRNVDARLSLGDVLWDKGDVGGAIAEVREVIRLDPRNAVAYVKLGGALLYGKRDADGAITELRKAIGFDPKNALAYIHLGRCLLEKGDRTGAMAALLTGLELEPNVLNYNNVAMLLAAGPDGVRDGKRAVELATRACELTDWKDPVILDTLAAAYAEVGDFDKAVEYQKKALSFPTFPKAEEAGGRARLDLYANKRPYRDPALAPREVAPPPREVK